MNKEIHPQIRTQPVLPEAIPQLRKQIEATQVELRFIKAGLALIPMQDALGSMLDGINTSVNYVLNLYVALGSEKNASKTIDAINAQLELGDLASVLSGIEASARLRLSTDNEQLGLRAADSIKMLDAELAELIGQYKSAVEKNPEATDEQFKALAAKLMLIILFKTSVAGPSPALESALNKVSAMADGSDGSVVAAAEAVLNFRPEGSPKEFGATLTERFEFHQKQIRSFLVPANELAGKLSKTVEELESLEEAVENAGSDAIRSKVLKGLEDNDTAALSTELCDAKTRASNFGAELADAVRGFLENAPEAKIDPKPESDKTVLEGLLAFWRLVPEYPDSHLRAAEICEKLGMVEEAKAENALYDVVRTNQAIQSRSASAAVSSVSGLLSDLKMIQKAEEKHGPVLKRAKRLD